MVKVVPVAGTYTVQQHLDFHFFTVYGHIRNQPSSNSSERLGAVPLSMERLSSPFVIPSEPGFPTSQLSPVPHVWFSLKRTTAVHRSCNS